MGDGAALVLWENAPEDKTRNERLGARSNLYMAIKKWDIVAAVANQQNSKSPKEIEGNNMMNDPSQIVVELIFGRWRRQWEDLLRIGD
jgi:hypothetical protein